jgi:hypothetical protein
LVPPFPSEVPAAVIAAYRETIYRAEVAEGIELRVGAACAALLDLHRAHRVECSAFVTACNPWSVPLSEAQNRLRQAALETDLRVRGLPFFPGVGAPPSNGWPGEPSFLVLGAALESARALGVRHGQNAVVWSGADAIPHLVMRR